MRSFSKTSSVLLMLAALLWLLPAPISHAGASYQEGHREPRAGKPAKHGDPFAEVPFENNYAARKQAFLTYSANRSDFGPYWAAARLAVGLPLDESCLDYALAAIKAREDCADFSMHGLIRLLYQFDGTAELTESVRAKIQDAILGFKYWPDEPGTDSMCYWSENHYILFSSAGYLTAQRYPDAVFTNSGKTGRERMPLFRERILRWLQLRFQTGFSEWLSNVYYDEDLTALMNLVDFCQDGEIQRKAEMVADLLAADMALNSFRGVLGCTHGRSYEEEKKWAATENTGSACKILFGTNRFHAGAISATCLALSDRYRLPRVLYAIANDASRPEMLNEQRSGIRMSDTARFGLNPNRLEDGMLFYSLEAYANPKTIGLTMRMMDAYRFWDNSFFEPFRQKKDMLRLAERWRILPPAIWFSRHDVQRNQRESANVYTYRTPDYMLSCAQDYKRGYGGDQQHVWQATLGPNAVCFTTHPVQGEQDSPNYWTGSGTLPRAAQIKNVALILYRLNLKSGPYVTHDLPVTHAWLPRDQFDEVVARGNWVMARKGDGYLALWSRQTTHWQTEEGVDKDRELIAPGAENVWICELGRRATDGAFDAFVDRIAGARVQVDGLDVAYASPSQGLLQFGWNGGLRQSGRLVPLSDHPRYRNPYITADYPAATITMRHENESLVLDWAAQRRDASAYCE